MCRPEIARKLVIGVSTARSHAKNIYGKLGVHGRVQAIERSRAGLRASERVDCPFQQRSDLRGSTEYHLGVDT